jgi:Protein of unknown function (DUF1499)
MSRVIYAPNQPPSFLARWGSRLALFASVLLLVTIFLHRLFTLPTPVALNIAAGCFAAAALVLVMSAVAGLDIWVTGRQGASRVVVATCVSLALLAVPLSLLVASRKWPALNDVTTDVSNPPEFVEADRLKAPGRNPLKYPGERFAALQQASYPDLKTLVIPRSAEESFELVLQAVAKLKMRSSYEAPPDEEPGAPGIVEIADRTMIMGFTDDVAIRITGDDASSRIDVRSTSRYGRSDFGRNAERVRTILKEIAGRLEASVPNGDAAERALRKKTAKAGAKPSPAGSQKSAGRGKQLDLSRSEIRRERERKASQPAEDEPPNPGRRRELSGE